MRVRRELPVLSLLEDRLIVGEHSGWGREGSNADDAKTDGGDPCIAHSLRGDFARTERMMRFLFGALVGASVMYWYLTGQIPYRDEAERWFHGAASSYKGESHHSEADRIIGGGKATHAP
jgi:hypothetical protein